MSIETYKSSLRQASRGQLIEDLGIADEVTEGGVTMFRIGIKGAVTSALLKRLIESSLPKSRVRDTGNSITGGIFVASSVVAGTGLIIYGLGKFFYRQIADVMSERGH